MVEVIWLSNLGAQHCGLRANYDLKKFAVGCQKKQRCDQCMLGASDEHQRPIQKATGFISNFKLRRTSKRCSGHRGKPHAHLQGKVGSSNRTSLAAVDPRALCQELCKDIIAFLGEVRAFEMHSLAHKSSACLAQPHVQVSSLSTWSSSTIWN